VFRLLSSAALALVAVVACTVLAAPATAATESTALPPAFEVAATNGYKAFVFVGGSPARAELVLNVRKRNGSAFYAAPAHYTETSIEANLGKLGEINVHAVPTGHPKTEGSNCDGGGKHFTVESGHWEGTIRFRGEEGFTSIAATSVTATAAPLVELVCGGSTGSEGIGGHSPGAFLTVKRRTGNEGLELTVRKNRKVGPTRLTASVSERRGAIHISRQVADVAPSKDFEFEIPPGEATVHLPGPFSGSIELTRRPGSSPSVKGEATVDFPGRAGVPVFGPGKLRASLIRAVLNPSHPF
jgi:hypothetical protein